jgi:hypothetical protein
MRVIIGNLLVTVAILGKFALTTFTPQRGCINYIGNPLCPLKLFLLCSAVTDIFIIDYAHPLLYRISIKILHITPLSQLSIQKAQNAEKTILYLASAARRYLLYHAAPSRV